MPFQSALLPLLAHLSSAVVTISKDHLSFEEFRNHFGRTYEPGSEEYQLRRDIFEKHVANVQQVNGNPGSSWRASINKLADRTPEELARLRGYRRQVRPGGGGAASARSPVEFLTKSATPANISQLPKDFNWKGRLQATTDITDQGQCGSCWAFASAVVLRAHSELFQEDRQFSVQQIVSCTTNPMECGGSGGCDGATAELAMDYVWRSGCMTDSEHPYHETVQQCPVASRQVDPHPNSGGVAGGVSDLQELYGQATAMSTLDNSGDNVREGNKFGMFGWSRLPENKLEPVLFGLINNGPAVVSLHSGTEWNLYAGGVLNSCPKDIVIDHAVMLLGWGVEDEHPYWQLQNSWGPDWGEDGYIRVLRDDHHQEGEYCGWDTDPSIGSGCSDGPPKVWVCGHCGILNDVVQPHFSLRESGWWVREGGRSVPTPPASLLKKRSHRPATSRTFLGA